MNTPRVTVPQTRVNRKHPADILDQIALLWDTPLTTLEMGAKLGVPKNTVCGKARTARLAGDLRFPARQLGSSRRRNDEPTLVAPPPERPIPSPPTLILPLVRAAPEPRRQANPRPKPVPRPRPKPLPPEAPYAGHASLSTLEFLQRDGGAPRVWELCARDCRYPVLEDTSKRHRFCAAPQQPKSPYCKAHHTLCNPAPQAKVRR